jgi:hypothetical protein
MSVIDKLVEIRLGEQDDFLKVRETLTRIGVASSKTKTIYQSCHILHKQGLYYIVHFKELFALDGKPSNLTSDDIGRRNTIISLLDDWGLIKVVDTDKIKEPRLPLNLIKILPHKEKGDWELVAKYNIGRKAVPD